MRTIYKDLTNSGIPAIKEISGRLLAVYRPPPPLPSPLLLLRADTGRPSSKADCGDSGCCGGAVNGNGSRPMYNANGGGYWPA